ncbi:MAG: methyltransferase domain-containing protein [Acidobacteria bacterium]|nr:methyltransferase domain-containing protein [Acidobacteriota bacterium]
MTDTSRQGPGAALPNPALIMRLAMAHRSSMVLFAATDLGVFTALGDGPRTAAEIAEATGTVTEPLRMLLEAAAAEGLLTVAEGRYENTPMAAAFLRRDTPAYIGNVLKYAENLYQPWGSLAQLVRTGRPVIDPESILGDDKAKTRAFVFAMHERAQGLSAVLPHGADFSGRRRLLDVGGGPGTYSIGLVKRTPGLSSTVMDLPGVLEVTREIVHDSGCDDRISLVPGDYRTTEFGTGFDAVLLSGMMHRETPATCLALLRKAFAALEPGGMVVVSDVFFEDDTRTTPPFSLYFALNMMLTSEEGSAHAKTQMVAWMQEAGFSGVDLRPLPPPNPHTLVVGTRP